jgi:LuxR family transcriptional regulator, activator of conjugal transfer of Ti plasmids
VNYQGATEKLANELSQRERECLLWAARGKTYMEIGLILGLRFGSVKTHLDHCRYKLSSATLAQATATAVVRGLITADDLRGAL